jgi:hypothetical protein
MGAGVVGRGDIVSISRGCRTAREPKFPSAMGVDADLPAHDGNRARCWSRVNGKRSRQRAGRSPAVNDEEAPP